MLILGITGGIDSLFDLTTFPLGLGHDAAAVLIEDGRVIAGIEEERLNRIKHTSKIWASSVRFCLESTKKSLSDVDAVAFYASEGLINSKLKNFQILNPALNAFTDARHLYQSLFEHEFGCKLDRHIFRFINHHTAHTAAAYYMSGFDNCLVLTIDGEGDDASGTVVSVENSHFSTLAIKSVPDSLGHFYLNVIFFLGYKDFDEYKVMGLAPYGKGAIYKEQFKKFYSLLPNGDYTIHTDQIDSLYEILMPRKRGEPFTQVHKDIAAALQEALEDIVFHMLRYYRETTGHTRLAIGGGVGQNSSLNGKILRSGLFGDVFSPSFSGDSGCAYGAAAYVAFQERPEFPHSRVKHAYWGSPINEDEISSVLASWQDFLNVEKMHDTAERVTDLMIDGSVIGWVQGCSEFGPRALGNRSILADPRLASHKDTINAMIKKREGYRPFAPSILEERVRDFFVVPGRNEDFEYMSFVLEVKMEWREKLPAITHVDGTARLQTVSRTNNQRYWDLINVFGKKTGIPILLNTSFNNNAEPIVDSIADAIVCYLTSGLDYLVIGDYLASKKAWGKNELIKLAVSLPKAARLICEDYYVSDDNREYSYSMVWNYEPDIQHPISEEWYKILRSSHGEDSLATVMKVLDFTSEQVDSVIKDLPLLWSDRRVLVFPY